MPENHNVPTDEVTGLPHVILPYNVPPNSPNARTDYHHHFFPRRSPELYRETAGLYSHVVGVDETGRDILEPRQPTVAELGSFAVRYCRGQYIVREIHNLAHRKYNGPLLPSTIEEKFQTAVKGCAGVVSRYALDVRLDPGTDEALVYMDDITFQRATNKRVLCAERGSKDKSSYYRRRVLGDFFLLYAVEQDLNHITPRIIEEFLDTKKDTRRRELGGLILKEAITVSLDPILPLHNNLRKQGFVQPGSLPLRDTVKKFILPDRIPRAYDFLAARLAS